MPLDYKKIERERRQEEILIACLFAVLGVLAGGGIVFFLDWAAA